MLSVASRAALVRRAGAAAPSSFTAVRAFSSSPVAGATLREIEGRVKSVKNIAKITGTMKLIASAKLSKAQNAMKTAKQYGEANVQVFNESELAEDSASSSSESGAPKQKVLWLVVSSDRGLCGGIHSSVSKKAKRTLIPQGAEEPDPEVQVVVLGDKPKQQLGRAIPNNMILSFNQIGRAVPTFADACAIADQIESMDVKYDSVKIIYNKFVSGISYEASVMEVFNAAALKASPKFAAYELEDADDALVGDLANFALTNAIFATLVEAHATEISARRNAMDNASKNAGEMISKLQMQFNRQRQAVITNELVDIITGASAL